MVKSQGQHTRHVLSCLVVPNSATPWTVAQQAPLSIGLFQTGTLEWVAISFSRGSSRPDQTRLSCMGRWILNRWATREAAGHEAQAKSRPPPDFVNKVLLECSHSHSFLYLWGCFFTPVAELTVVMETMWPAEAKIFTNCLFTENVCDPSSLRKRVWLQVHNRWCWGPIIWGLIRQTITFVCAWTFPYWKVKKKKKRRGASNLTPYTLFLGNESIN